MEPVSRPSLQFAERLARVRREIAEAGRDPAEITIVGVTKGRPLEDCRDAIAGGLTALAENRVAVGLDRVEALPGVEWHLIGHLQSNKVRLAAGRFSLIQSVDSARLGELIAGRDPGQAVLLQVNVSGEAEKSGCAPFEAVAVCCELARMLPLRGVMGMGPLAGASEVAFGRLARIRAEAEQGVGHALPVLSMGMSGDYGAALRAGSTMLRLGRTLFG